MTQHQCLKLQRKARRSGRIRPNACLLLAEICDFHGLERGCIIENEGLADRLGCTERSVRTWLRELKANGLVTEGEDGDNRVLVPRVPSWMDWKDASSVESSFHSDTESSGNDIPQRKDASTSSGKKLPTQRVNNPEGGEERAPAQEASVRETDHPAVQVFVEEVGRRPHAREQMEIPDVVGQTEPRLAAFRRQCQKAVRNAGSPDRVRWGYLADDFEQAMEREKTPAGGDGEPTYSLENFANAPGNISPE